MFSLTLGPVVLSLELLAIYAALFVAWLVIFLARQKENSAADALFYVFCGRIGRVWPLCGTTGRNIKTRFGACWIFVMAAFYG